MDILSWNWALIVIAFITLINVINGFKKGLVKELINCISLLVLSILVVLLSSVLKSYTDKQFVQMLTMIIMVLVLSIAHKLVKMALDGMKVLASLPIISTLNKLAGTVFGVIETVVLVWFALCLIGMFDLGTIGEYINMYIGNSELLTYLYENNLIATLGETILGPEFQMKALDIILEQGKDIVGNIL